MILLVLDYLCRSGCSGPARAGGAMTHIVLLGADDGARAAATMRSAAEIAAVIEAALLEYERSLGDLLEQFRAATEPKP